MGYDVERFVCEVKPGLLCCICRDVLEVPEQAPCEHTFCRECIRAWLLTEPTCPEDRRPLTLSDLRPIHRYMRNDLNQLQVRCVHHVLGCTHVCSLEFVRQHEDTCPHAPVTCPHSACRANVARRDLEQHVQHCRHAPGASSSGFAPQETMPGECGCLRELQENLEALRTEVRKRLEEQQREMDLRLDMQRGHMVQREAAMQQEIADLKGEVSRLSQKIRLLMELEAARRAELERMSTERQEIMRLLESLQEEQKKIDAGRCCRTCSKPSKVTTI